MQIKNILLSVFASAALINAVAIPATTDARGAIDPTTEPSYPTCVSRVGSHRRGTHLPTDADKAKYAKICTDCYNGGYEANEMTTTYGKDVFAPSATDPFAEYVKNCIGLKAGGPPAAKPATAKEVPVTVDPSRKRALGDVPHVETPGVTEPNVHVPASLVKLGKRALGDVPHVETPGVTEPNVHVPASLVKHGKN